MKFHELIGSVIVLGWTAFALVTLPACRDTGMKQQQEVAEPYPMSVNMAADNLRAAAEKAIEVDPYTARVVIASILANMEPAWTVPGPDVERVLLSWAPCPSGPPTVRYLVHFEADFVVDQPELALWFETDQCEGYQYQVAGIGTEGWVGGFSAPVVRGIGAMTDDEIVEGEPCPGGEGE